MSRAREGGGSSIWGGTAKGSRVSLWDDANALKITLWQWLYNSVNILKAIKLYTLNGWILWYVNDVSIKLLKILSQSKSQCVCWGMWYLCSLVNLRNKSQDGGSYLTRYWELLKSHHKNKTVLLVQRQIDQWNVIERLEPDPCLNRNLTSNKCGTTSQWGKTFTSWCREKGFIV